MDKVIKRFYFDMLNMDKPIGWGKYSAMSLRYVLSEDEGYINWLLQSQGITFSKTLKEYINAYMRCGGRSEKQEFLEKQYYSFVKKEKSNEEKKRNTTAAKKVEDFEKKNIKKYLINIAYFEEKTKSGQLVWTKAGDKHGTNSRRVFYTALDEGKKITLYRESYKNKENKWKHLFYMTCRWKDKEYKVEQIDVVDLWNEIVKLHSKKDEVKAIKKGLQTKEVTFVDMVVKTNVFACGKNHHIEDIVAVFMISRKDGTTFDIKAPAGYCKECDCYFILEKTYKEIKAKFKGRLLCQVVTDTYFKQKQEGTISTQFDGWAKESPLSIAGYSVSNSHNLSVLERRLILEYIIDSKLLSKSMVLSYLDFFVDSRRNMKNMESAISKWKEDRTYIKSYQMGSKKHVKVQKVIEKI